MSNSCLGRNLFENIEVVLLTQISLLDLILEKVILLKSGELLSFI